MCSFRADIVSCSALTGQALASLVQIFVIRHFFFTQFVQDKKLLHL